LREGYVRRSGRPKFGLARAAGRRVGNKAPAITNGDHWTQPRANQKEALKKTRRLRFPAWVRPKASKLAERPKKRAPANSGGKGEKGSAKSRAGRG